MFCRIQMIFTAIRLTGSKTRSIPSDGLLKSMLRMSLRLVFLRILGRLGSDKTNENLVFYECFAIFARIWLQHGRFVVQWLRRHFQTIFLLFFDRSGGSENGLKPCVLPIFCDFRSYLKILETSCSKKALECVFNRFLATLGLGKSVKNRMFYECILHFIGSRNSVRLTWGSNQIKQ